MLKNEEKNVFISFRNITHYRKLGYQPILNESLEIKTIDLPSSSHVKVDVICSICKKELNIFYYKYIENINRHNFYSCKSCSRQKFSLTCLEKYGVDNTSKLADVKEKRKETFMKRFGYETNLIHPEYKEKVKKRLLELYGTEKWFEIRNTNKEKFKINEEIYHLMINDFSKSEEKYNDQYLENHFILYRNEVKRLTNSKTKKLYENWDGYDFYDGEYILNYKNENSNNLKYPTIDHKLSIYWGFVNNISVDVIADLNNLCITKRIINSKKNISSYFN